MPRKCPTNTHSRTTTKKNGRTSSSCVRNKSAPIFEGSKGGTYFRKGGKKSYVKRTPSMKPTKEGSTSKAPKKSAVKSGSGGKKKGVKFAKGTKK